VNPASHERERAIQQVEANADPLEFEAAVDAVFVAAVRKPELTTDDVMEVLAGAWEPREPRVLGAVMRKAASLGWVTRTERWSESPRRESHARPKRVWTSLLWIAPEPEPAPAAIDTVPLF
jgi:hypothetical protein